MNVCTISVNINTPDYNYGALLHSWAFQRFLKGKDEIDHAVIIDYLTPHLEKYVFKCPIKYIKETKGKRAAIRFIINEYCWYLKRYNKFRSFIQNNIDKTEIQYTQKSLEEADLSYFDAVVCESDVIWSPQLTKGGFDRTFFAALDSMKGLKRIAYSPSMGDIDFTEENYRDFEKLVSNLDYISCRESYEKPVIERFTQKKVEHVLDPVMLLNANDYESITGDRILSEPYLLLYLPVDDNVVLREAAHKYAREQNLQILEISTKLVKRDEHVKTLLCAGVEEFLSAIKNADSVFTNSFHAICFSIIFEKEFYAFSRKYSGKVRDFCDSMGLSERYFSDDVFIKREPIAYEIVKSIWDEKRETSVRWIMSALTGKTDNNEPSK